MDGIMTTADLIEELKKQPPTQPVMIAVVKYPEEFALRHKDDGWSWLDSTDVEVQPLEHGEVTTQNGFTTIAVELMDYDAQRHFAGG